MPDCLPTSIANAMLGRMRVVHERARIAIFTGPPGIGKTTAIDALCDEFPRDVIKVTISSKNARGPLALRHVIRGLRAVNGGNVDGHIHTGAYQLTAELRQQLGMWWQWCAHGDPDRHLTIIFDEAQNLSREAVETMRHYNDVGSLDVPFRVGLVFVGNHELSLRVDEQGQSTISAAVSSRAFYKVALGDTALTVDDYHLILTHAGLDDRAGRDLIVKSILRPRYPRDLRQLMHTIEDLRDEAGDGPITIETVRSFLALA